MATTRSRAAAKRGPQSNGSGGLDGHFIVCGLDELGFRVAEELHRLGETAVVLVSERSQRFEGRLAALGTRLLVGDYRDENALRAAGALSARALLICEADDVGNLHSALAAHELTPALRIVLRIFNQELGQRMQSILRDCEVLSSSAIAAPSFVAAALQTDFEQRIEAGGRELVVRHGAVGGPGVLLAIARQEADGTLTLFPEEGDNVLCLADFRSGRRAERRRRRRLIPTSVRAAWHLIATLADKRVRYLLGVVGALLLLSLVMLHLLWNLSIFDTIYFTVTTITTIGYGDITLLNAPIAVRIYGIALELLGAATMAIFFAVITDSLVGARLHHVLGGLHHDIDDHVVICGLGNMGHRVAEQIHGMGVPVVAMELNESAKTLPLTRRLGIPVLLGDARELANLERLRVAHARCLVVATPDDMTNLEIALAARGLNPELKVVLQLHDSDLAARIQRAIGVGISRSLAGLAAPAFVSAGLGHRISSAIPVGDRLLVIAGSTLVLGAEAAGRTIAWLQGGPYARVLMIGRAGQSTWCPSSDTVMEPGDELIVVATRKGLDGVLRLTEAPPTDS